MDLQNRITKLFNSGKYDKCLKLIDEFLVNSKSKHDINTGAKFTILKSHILTEKYAFTQAEDTINQFLKNEELNAPKYISIKIEALIQKSNIFGSQGKFQESLVVIESIRKLLDENPDINNKSKFIADLYLIEANYQTKQHDLEKAKEKFMSAINIYKKLGKEVTADFFSVYNEYIHEDWFKGDLKTTKKKLEASLRFARLMSSQFHQAKIQYNIGTLLMMMNELNEAVLRYEESEKLSRKIKNKSLELKSSENIARICFIRGQLDKALEYYNKILENFKEIDNKFLIGQINSKIGDIYFEKELFEKSEKNYLLCLEQYRILNVSNIYLSEALFNVCNTYIEKNDKENTKKYFKHLKEIHLSSTEVKINENRYLYIKARLLEVTSDDKKIHIVLRIYKNLSLLDGDYNKNMFLATLRLCRIQLNNFRIYQQENSLNEIRSNINRIINYSQKEKSVILMKKATILINDLANIGNY